MKVTTRKGKAFLKLDGEMTVGRASEFKDALLKSLEKSDTVEVNFNDVDKVDLSCLQLLCSAHRTAATKGKTLTVKDQSLPLYIEARKNAGLIYSKPCRFVTTGDCLWIGEEQ